MLQVNSSDKFCFVNPERGIEYTGYEYQVVKYGPVETAIKDPQTGERLTFYNAHLYVSREQRRRSNQKRIADAQAIGRKVSKR